MPKVPGFDWDGIRYRFKAAPLVLSIRGQTGIWRPTIESGLTAFGVFPAGADGGGRSRGTVFACVRVRS